MPLCRPPRLFAAALCLSLLVPLAAQADNAKPTWDPARVTAPDDVKELRALQETVKRVVDKVTPATVGVLLGMGAGSGVIVSDDGLVLTAAHVIEPPRRGGGDSEKRTVTLQLFDGTKVKGDILGRNPKADSGMVKITDPVPKDANWPGAKQGKWP